VAAPASVIPDRKNEYYKSDEECLFAIGAAMRTEYKMIVDAGFLLQLDDARAAVTYDRMVPPAAFADYRKWVDMHMEVLNHAIEGLPPERIRYHVCWGSWPGPHTTDVPLKEIVDLILKVKVGAYVIEGANPRHEHEWKVWKDVKLPDGKVLIPGVISHATNVVEHPELVAERIGRYAGLVGARTCWRERIAVLRRAPSTGESIPRSCGQSSRRWRKARALPARNCGVDGRSDCQRGFDRTRSMLKRPGPVRNRSRAPPRIARFLRKLVY
jgi:methionine synthase II (cobalamin-independent)